MRFVFLSKSTKGVFSVKKRVKLVNYWSELPYFNQTTTIKRVSHFQHDVRLNCPMKYIGYHTFTYTNLLSIQKC